MRIGRGLVHSVRHRRVETSDERLAWLLIVATIPAGLTGVRFDHSLRTRFAKPTPAGAFLIATPILLAASTRSPT